MFFASSDFSSFDIAKICLEYALFQQFTEISSWFVATYIVYCDKN